MVSSHLVPALASAADSAIGKVLARGAVQVGQTPPSGEVGFVAAVVLGGVADIAAAWKPILQPAGLSARLHGVFCHQAPQVSFVDAKKRQRACELADLLVVVEDQLTGTNQRWAALVQAKMASAGGGKHLHQPGDLVQHELLSTWPRFNMPHGYASHARDFATCTHPGQQLDSGRYGLIDRKQGPVWFQQAPSRSLLSSGTQLGTFMARMMETGQVGYGREATGIADDWSFTVDELLSRTASLTFTHAASFPGSLPRGVTALALAVTDGGPSTIVIDGASGTPPPPGPEEEFGSGMSVLRVQIREAGEG